MPDFNDNVDVDAELITKDSHLEEILPFVYSTKQMKCFENKVHGKTTLTSQESYVALQ